MPVIPVFWIAYYFFARYFESAHNKVGAWVTVARALGGFIVFGAMTSEGASLASRLVVQFLIWCPGLWIPRLVVPLGAPRLAYYVTRLTYPLGFWCEPQGGAAFMAALACAHQRRPSERQLTFVEDRLPGAATTVGGATMAGYAILASLRGDLERARGLFFVVARLHWRHVAHRVRAHAFEWLAADALEHGTSESCFELPWWRRPRFTWFLDRLRARMEPGGERISTASLAALWMVAPHRRVGLRLLRSALRQPEPAAATAARSVQEAALVWQEALEAPELRARIGRRLAELGGKSSPERVLELLREGMRSELVERLKHESARLSEDAPLLALDARGQLLAHFSVEVEERLRVVSEMADEVYPEPLLVWGHWASLQRDLLRVGALDPDDPAKAHHLSYPNLHDWGVGLLNHARQGMLAHDIFYFSAKEAGRARDSEARKFCLKNASACR
jgi:hypothetical protein